MKTPRVENMLSNKGRAVPNQFLIYTDNGVTFQSYGSIIATKDNAGNVTLDEEYWDYSVTTGRYRNEFLQEGIADTRRKIESGEYKLAKLNQ